MRHGFNRCGRSTPIGCGGLRVLGACLMALGLILILIFVPFQFWFALLGAMMLAAGFILLRCLC
ncbi:MAG: intracellular growth attenuator family protein [Clostridiales bacterium]|nr:intracellular growth attenuator family protein [Clostridiales bacterium]